MSTVKDEIQRISRSQSETVGELAKWSDLIDKIGAILAIVAVSYTHLCSI